MTAFVFLLVCVAAQVLIAAGLGIYFLRQYWQRRRQKSVPPPDYSHSNAPGKREE